MGRRMSTPAIEPPASRLDGFPQITVGSDFKLYRAGHPSGPWWFTAWGGCAAFGTAPMAKREFVS